MTVLAVLLTLSSDPTVVTPVAQAIEEATSSPEEQAFLVALGWHESRFARYVVEGHCSEGPVGARCDHGHARTPWQVHS